MLKYSHRFALDTTINQVYSIRYLAFAYRFLRTDIILNGVML